jgi:hydrogenase expression/formation protein HypE
MSRVKKGDKIVVSGNIATHGVAIMSVREGLDFETTIESDTCNLNHTITKLLDEFGDKIHLLRDPTRGGVATVLNEIARDSKLGIDIFQKHIPIVEEVYSACELLGLDPLYVANEGVFLAVVDAEIADDFVKILRNEIPTKAGLRRCEYGENAAIMGEVVETHPRQVILTSKIGGKRVVNMLVGEQLPRIC